MLQNCEHDSGKRIVPRMRDHAGPQTAATNGKKAKHRSIRGDGDHAADAFVAMRAAEEQRGCDHADPDVAADRSELLQKVTAKDKFLDEARGAAERDPNEDLEEVLGRERDDGFLRRSEMKEAQQSCDGGEEGHGDDPEEQCDAEVERPLSGPAAAEAEDFAQRRAAQMEPPPDEQRQDPLPRKSDGVALDVAASEAGGLGLEAAKDGDSDEKRDEQGGVPPGRDRVRSCRPSESGREWCRSRVL